MQTSVSSPQIENSINSIAHPFLKWAGGKTQLLGAIQKALPKELSDKKFSYVEPFVGSGAVLFCMLRTFENIEKLVINDVNEHLINCYRTIAQEPKALSDILENWQAEFYALNHDKEQEKLYFYGKRNLYNSKDVGIIERSALFIFLNKTCFNGLYRVNRKGKYNVPVGDYKKPKICDRNNIMAVHKALQNVQILCGDFEQTLEYANESSFFYFDPPYKPLSSTSSFTAYSQGTFDDGEQIRLRNFCEQLNKKNAKWMLSNSDLSNTGDNFFDDIYADFRIEQVKVSRSISANSQSRGELSELLIRNY